MAVHTTMAKEIMFNKALTILSWNNNEYKINTVQQSYGNMKGTHASKALCYSVTAKNQYIDVTFVTRYLTLHIVG